MKTPALLSIASIALLIGCTNVKAQSSTVSTIMDSMMINPNSPEWAKKGYLQVPFNVASQKLPVNFKGHSAKQVYAALGDDDNKEKGKFETTAQYQARLKKTPSRLLFGTVQKSSPFAFSVGASWTDYDADSQQMRVNFGFLQDNDSDNLGIVTEAGSSASGKYTGQNGFGAQVQISEQSESKFGFCVTNKQQFWFAALPSQEYDIEKKYRLSFNLPIPLKSAPAFEKNVRALYIGYIAPPDKEMALTDYHKATFDSPYQTSSWRLYACLRVKSVWLYDGKTGYVYAKMNPKS